MVKPVPFDDNIRVIDNVVDDIIAETVESFVFSFRTYKDYRTKPETKNYGDYKFGLFPDILIPWMYAGSYGRSADEGRESDKLKESYSKFSHDEVYQAPVMKVNIFNRGVVHTHPGAQNYQLQPINYLLFSYMELILKSIIREFDIDEKKCGIYRAHLNGQFNSAGVHNDFEWGDAGNSSNLRIWNPHYDTTFDVPISFEDRKKIKTVIYYINDIEGDTIIYRDQFSENPNEILKEVSPKRNRVVMFPAVNFHRGKGPGVTETGHHFRANITLMGYFPKKRIEK